MQKTLNIALGLAIVALVRRDAVAQWNVARFDAEPNRFYTSFGLDPALVTTMGYARVLPIFGHNFQFSGDAAIGAVGVDANDFRARAQALTSVVQWGDFHLTGSATAITRGTKNSIYRGLNFGADFTAAGGYYRPGWFVAGEYGYDKAVITHVRHTDWYRKNVFPDAKDGWYIDAGGTLHHGVMGGVTLGRVELVGRVGWLRTEEFNDLTPPMYVTLGTGIKF